MLSKNSLLFKRLNRNSIILQRSVTIMLGACVLVMVVGVHCAHAGYVLEGAVAGKWHDSGITYNK